MAQAMFDKYAKNGKKNPEWEVRVSIVLSYEFKPQAQLNDLNFVYLLFDCLC